METDKEPRPDETDSAPFDLDIVEESINIADSHIDLTPTPPADQSEEQPKDKAAMFSAQDDLTADWAQWMRWDDIEDTKPSIFNIPNIPGSSLPQSAFTFTSDDAILPTHTLGPSNGSISLPAVKQPSVSTIFQEQPAIETIQPAPPSDASSPLAPSPTSSVGRKRKSSHDDSPVNDVPPAAATAAAADKSAPSKKRSHNIIEKRYRANLNDKIAELRDSVPSLRLTYKQRHGGNLKKSNEDDDIDLTSGNKLNKASILSKATEYIKHLELRNSRLEEENLSLKNRFRELEKAQGINLVSYPAVTGSETPSGACTVSTSSVVTSPDIFSHSSDFSPDSPPNPLFPPEGLLRPPDGFNQLRPTGPQPHYADAFQYNQPQEYDCAPLENASTATASSSETTTRSRRQFMGLPNKFMLGTLAGIMVMGGFESHRSSDPEEKKELFAFPLQFLGSFYRLALQKLYFIRANSWQIRALSQFALTSLILFGCAFFVFLYLFNSRPRVSRVPLKPSRTRNVSAQQQVSTGCSFTEFRQDAWLTSIQTVGVPRHNFFPEWFAVTSRCLEYCVRCLLGWKLYSFVTGISADDEKGRVKAWDIALDAQLTGGDAEVSKSRLVLTIFAAGTLPRSPARMMLKAFHCRVLLWRISSPDSLAFRAANYIAKVLANYQWELAQNMHRRGPKRGEDPLPSHLAFLLSMDCDEVFTDTIVQRASNMVWNRPTQEATDGEDALLDVVVEDSAVRSPLDVLAAWWSSRALQEALLKSLDLVSVESPIEKRKSFERSLDIALHSAPIPSTAYTRATVVKALFFEEDRINNVNTVLATLPAKNSENSRSTCGLTNFLDSSIPPSAREEIFIGVRCAMIAAILRGQVGRGEDEPASSPFSLSSAIKQFNAASVDEVELTLLGFASHYYLLHITATDERLLPCSSLASSMHSSVVQLTDGSETMTSYQDEHDIPIPDLSRIAADLIFWVRNAYNPISSGLNAKLMEKVVIDCVEVCHNAGVDIDIRKIQRMKTHQRTSSVGPMQVSARSPGPEGAPSGVTPVRAQGRRPSTFSDDTGYGSIDSEESRAIPTV
ncbi:HLH transcription factor [Trichophyton equinum CBS 127.97]|uniref:HLH transcription factor n=1 Tax=Trichophyton equinum (strain ATCC MYA-4606 / CBS 127.97) TaxID=559882 RepID=F2PNS5_TRIEC|nr:HLH transcription factor [Trichophyton equinum CBS 127.97]